MSTANAAGTRTPSDGADGAGFAEGAKATHDQPGLPGETPDPEPGALRNPEPGTPSPPDKPRRRETRPAAIAAVAAVAAVLAVVAVVATLIATSTRAGSPELTVAAVASDGVAFETTSTPDPTTSTEPLPTTGGPEPVPSTSIVHGPPLTLPSDTSEVAYAKNDGAFPIYARPAGTSPARTIDNPRLINDDPNAKVPLLFLVKQDRGDWLEVYLPVRPNGSTGWVKRSDIRVTTHDYRIEVFLYDYRLVVYKGKVAVMDTRIGVAAANAPTPGGIYFTTELLQPPDPGGAYGPYAYGLSGFSDTYYSFGAGNGQLGIHGTNQPWSIGQAASHGCIRLRNDDITRLAGLLPLGVPVLVNA